MSQKHERLHFEKGEPGFEMMTDYFKLCKEHAGKNLSVTDTAGWEAMMNDAAAFAKKYEKYELAEQLAHDFIEYVEQVSVEENEALEAIKSEEQEMFI